jgi:hypothetical protein
MTARTWRSCGNPDEERIAECFVQFAIRCRSKLAVGNCRLVMCVGVSGQSFLPTIRDNVSRTQEMLKSATFQTLEKTVLFLDGTVTEPFTLADTVFISSRCIIHARWSGHLHNYAIAGFRDGNK